jgi:hypothetical protein
MFTFMYEAQLGHAARSRRVHGRLFVKNKAVAMQNPQRLRQGSFRITTDGRLEGEDQEAYDRLRARFRLKS